MKATTLVTAVAMAAALQLNAAHVWVASLHDTVAPPQVSVTHWAVVSWPQNPGDYQRVTYRLMDPYADSGQGLVAWWEAPYRWEGETWDPFSEGWMSDPPTGLWEFDIIEEGMISLRTSPPISGVPRRSASLPYPDGILRPLDPPDFVAPEPEAYALMAGLGLVVFAIWRRFRSCC